MISFRGTELIYGVLIRVLIWMSFHAIQLVYCVFVRVLNCDVVLRNSVTEYSLCVSADLLCLSMSLNHFILFLCLFNIYFFFLRKIGDL